MIFFFVGKSGRRVEHFKCEKEKVKKSAKIGLSRDIKSLLPKNVDKKLKIFIFNFLTFSFSLYNIF